MRLHLGLWGLPEVVEDAQLCVTELLSNVIAHVGAGTPTTLAVSMNGSHLRIEIQDPDTRALPTLLQPGADSEGGRGMALVDAMAVRWGVELQADRKITWCELAAKPGLPLTRQDSARLSRAEELLDLYRVEETLGVKNAGSQRLSLTRAEEAAIDIITDLLHWLHSQVVTPTTFWTVLRRTLRRKPRPLPEQRPGQFVIEAYELTSAGSSWWRSHVIAMGLLPVCPA